LRVLGGLGSGSARSLVIRFIADTARASRDIDNLMLKVRKIHGMGAPKEGYLAGGFRGIFGQMEYSLLNRLTRGFKEMGESGAVALEGLALKLGIITGSLIAFGYTMKKTFEFGNLVEGATLQLEVLTQNVQRAHGMMREARMFSIRTPFTPSETFMATAMAEQFGINPYRKGAYNLGQNRFAMEVIAGLGSYRDIQGRPMGMARAVYALARGDRRLLRPYGTQVQQDKLVQRHSLQNLLKN
jgi:hypothetical protein